MTSDIRAYWPLATPLSLGNVLIFRQEIELLARIRNVPRAHIYFETREESAPFYLKEALLSRIPIQWSFSSKPTEKIDWPPHQTEVGKWPYSSFRRVSLLKEISGISPQLSWPIEVEQAAKKQYLQLKRNPVIAVHLKQQNGGPEESNADLKEWGKIFQETPHKTFILLGADKMPEWLTGLKNVKTSLQLGMNLSEQLAFCAIADAFLGMASGICAGAFFSSTPYVVFKHPSHHSEEMNQEMGLADHLPFSLDHQKLWRKPDHRNHLIAALQMIHDCQGRNT